MRCGYIRSEDERKDIEQAADKKDIAQQLMYRALYEWVELNEQGIIHHESTQWDKERGRTYTTDQVYSLTPQQRRWNQDKEDVHQNVVVLRGPA